MSETPDSISFAITDRGIGANERGSVPFEKGVSLILDDKTSEVIGLQFDRKEFPGAETISKWNEESVFQFADQLADGSIRLESGNKLYAPKFNFKVQPIELIAGQVEFLAMRALPLTPGVHKGFTFSAEVIMRAAPLYLNAPIVEHHLFNVPADVKGRIRDVETVMERVIVTALIDDPSSIADVRSGHFHSVSSHILMEADDSRVVLQINEVVELTLTPDPADPDAVILDHKGVSLLIAESDREMFEKKVALWMENKDPGNTLNWTNASGDSKFGNLANWDISDKTLVIGEGENVNFNLKDFNLKSPEAEASKHLEDTNLEQNPTTNEPSGAPTSTAPVAAPAPVSLEATRATPTQNAHELAMSQRIAELEQNAQKSDEAMKLMLARQRVKDAILYANRLVMDGRISKTQEESAGKLLSSLTDSQKELFESFLKENQVAPLGGVEAADAGMVSSDQLTSNVSMEKIMKGMTNRELEMLQFSLTTQEAESRGMFGPEAQAKHLKDGFFDGMFPTIKHGNAPDREGWSQ